MYVNTLETCTWPFLVVPWATVVPVLFLVGEGAPI